VYRIGILPMANGSAAFNQNYVANWPVDQFFNLRVLRSGSTMQVKNWNVGEAEPEAWGWSITHAAVATSGSDRRNGFITYAAGNYSFDTFSVTGSTPTRFYLPDWRLDKTTLNPPISLEWDVVVAASDLPRMMSAGYGGVG